MNVRHLPESIALRSTTPPARHCLATVIRMPEGLSEFLKNTTNHCAYSTCLLSFLSACTVIAVLSLALSSIYTPLATPFFDI